MDEIAKPKTTHIGIRDFSALNGEIIDLGDAFSPETEKEIANMMNYGSILPKEECDF